MNDDCDSPAKLCFGAFQVDLRSGELSKNGSRIKLQEQPFQILARLLHRPGAVVTREELRQALWPSGIHVDFENGLNIAIKKLRQALADDADVPRFIETLPRCGYRFIARPKRWLCPVAKRPGHLRAIPQSRCQRNRAA